MVGLRERTSANRDLLAKASALDDLDAQQISGVPVVLPEGNRRYDDAGCAVDRHSEFSARLCSDEVL